MTALMRIIYVMEILLAELIFLFPARKRKHFPLRYISAVGAALVFAYFFNIRDIPMPVELRNLVEFVVLLGLSLGAMAFSFDLNFFALFSNCAAGYAVEHIAYQTAKLFYLTTTFFQGITLWNIPRYKIVEFVIFPPIYLITLLTLGMFSARNRCYEKADSRFNFLSITIIFLCIGITRIAYLHEEENSISICIYAIALCVFALLYQVVLYRMSDLKHENEMVNLLWKEDRKQYELSKTTLETFNIKYHDLKHKLAALKGRLPDEEIASLKDSVRIFDSGIRTGNEALDVILTENSLRCKAEGILITYMGNGANLSFMSVMDVYSLFGNAVDNAIEATRKLSDPEKRVISITIECIGDMVSIDITNYYDGKLETKNGLPVTSKKDEKGYHGFGMKSMKLITEKYDGSLTLEADGEMFSLGIFLMAK